jgi:DNA-binding IclR family transcriptional regulator
MRDTDTDGSPVSGVGTLDRAFAIISAMEAGASRFTQIAEAAGLSRPTAHRLLHALEAHGFVARYGAPHGYRLGPRLLRLASEAMRELPLRDLAHPALERLVRVTGESAQLFVRSGDVRVCIDAVESPNELRTIVPVGASLPLTAGSAAKVFLASSPAPERLIRKAEARERFTHEVELARSRGWASSAGERDASVGSVSAPVVGPLGILLAVVSVSGPVTRMGRINARRYVPAVLDAAKEIERAAGSGGGGA